MLGPQFALDQRECYGIVHTRKTPLAVVSVSYEVPVETVARAKSCLGLAKRSVRTLVSFLVPRRVGAGV
eukprot:8591684-Pyramimonas_sp.AAC.1